MEKITDHLRFSVEAAPLLGDSHCRVSERPDGWDLEYYLSARDCLFDVADTNYVIRFRVGAAFFAPFGEGPHLRPRRQTLCCGEQLKVHEIVRCTATGLSRKLQLQARFLDLLDQLLEKPVGCRGCAHLDSPLEAEQIAAARTYVLAHLDEKLTTARVAAAAGTNQCYLKRGFKEAYGQTLFEFIQEHRLTVARHLVETTDLPLTEVAGRVGYASASSLSQAFKGYFGVNPSVFANA